MTTPYRPRSSWQARIGLLLLLLSPALQASQTLTVAWSHWPPSAKSTTGVSWMGWMSA